MTALPLKRGWGPTLGHLLAPRWRKTPLAVRVALVAGVLAATAVIAAAVLTLVDTTYAQSSPVAFHFFYRDLYRTAPDPGGYVKVQATSGRRLLNSFAVESLHLPPYRGAIGGYLPLYAAGYIANLQRHDADFELLGEGHTRINSVPGYAIDYSARLHGELLSGRTVLIVPPVAGARDGVAIVMLTRYSDEITGLAPVGTAEPLHRALRSFTFG